MTVEADMTQEIEIKCQNCDSEAIYKNGKVLTGRQRYLCLMCGKQFTFHTKRSEAKGKPVCHVCGKTMNLYMIEKQVIRFRCSGYPECKTFKKFKIVED